MAAQCWRDSGGRAQPHRARVQECKSRRVEEWKSGRVEEWKSGRVEERKSGSVLVQPEMEKRRSPLVSIPPFGRGFSRHGVFRSDGGWGGARTNPRAPVHRLDEPTGYPSAWLRPRSARFRFARQNHCSSATTCRFSTSSWPVIPPKPRPRQTQIVSVIALVTTVTVVSRKFGAEML